MLELDEYGQALYASMLNDPALATEVEALVALELAQAGYIDGRHVEGVFLDAALISDIGTQANLLYAEQVVASLPIPLRQVYMPAPASPQRRYGRQRQQHKRGGLLTLVVSLAVLVICLCVLVSMVGGGNTATGVGQHQVQGHFSVVPANPVLAQPSADVLKQYNNNPYVITAYQAAVYYQINTYYFLRQINQESGFDPHSVSPAGAVGIAQFLPSTAAGMGVDPWDPTQSLYGAALYMSRRLHDYRGNYAMALASYNGGTGAVQDAVSACGSNWFNCLPGETHHYVCVIMNSC